MSSIGMRQLYLGTTQSASSTAVAGYINVWDCTSGVLVATLPPLSGLTEGQSRLAVQKKMGDYALLVVCSTGDVFSDGSSIAAIYGSGEQREFQVVKPSSTKQWKSPGNLNPVAMLNNFFKYPAKKQPVNITDGIWTTDAIPSSNVGTYRLIYNVAIDATHIQLLFANWSNTTSPHKDIPNNSTIVFNAAIEDPADNTIYQLLFNGSKTATLGPGATILSDPIDVEIFHATKLAVRTYMSSGSYQLLKAYHSSSGGGFTATTDLTASGSAAIADAATAAFGYGPVAILGIPLNSGVPKAILGQGDSRIAGNNDGANNFLLGYGPAKPYVSGGGWLMRAMYGLGSMINVAIAADRASYFTPNAGHYYRSTLAQYCRYGVIEYGINDISTSTYLQIAQNNLTIASRNLFRGITKNILTTLEPLSTSTDRWTTLVNQTTNANNSVRISYNNWVRAGGPIDATTLAPVAVGTAGALLFGHPLHPVCGYLEVADVVESSRDSGLWKVTGVRVVTDASWASGHTFGSATASFVSGDIGKDFVMSGIGAAGVDRFQVIDSITNATTMVEVAGYAVPSVVASGQTMAIGIWTRDGIHGSTIAHTAIAAAVLAQLTAYMVN